MNLLRRLTASNATEHGVMRYSYVHKTKRGHEIKLRKGEKCLILGQREPFFLLKHFVIKSPKLRQIIHHFINFYVKKKGLGKKLKVVGIPKKKQKKKESKEEIITKDLAADSKARVTRARIRTSAFRSCEIA